MFLYTSVAVFLFSTLSLVIPSGFSLGAVMLVTGSAVLPLKRIKPALTKADYVLIVVLVQYFVICVLANMIHGEVAREYDIPSRFLLVVPALLLLLISPPRATAVWGGLAAGAIAAGIFAGWQNFDLGEGRADGFTNPIQFGNISLLLGVLCLAALGWANLRARTGFWTGLMLAGAALGVLGSMFSGSRGSWISLPFCLLVLCGCHIQVLGMRRIAAGLLGMVMLFSVLYAIPRTGVKARIQQAVAEADGYFQSHNADTSTGQRLEMWRVGLTIFPEHPWLGWGKQGYMNKKAQLIAAGKTTPAIREHTHLHNDYLDALVKRGLPGLASVLALYMLPLLLFAEQLKQASPERRPFAIAGLLLIVCYLGFGLTQAFLTHNNGVTMFAFLLVVFWSSLRDRAAGAPPRF